MMLFQFGLNKQSCSVDLVEPACGLIVSVDGEVRIVEDENGCFGHYKNISNKNDMSAISLLSYKIDY
jgi:hypothetical protein